MPTEDQGRIEDLEIRYAFLEQQLAALDNVVREVGDQVSLLRDELHQMRSQIAAQPGPEGSLEDDVPPHY